MRVLVAMAVAKESAVPETEKPLPPRRFPRIITTSPAPTGSAGAAVQSLLLDQGDAGLRGHSRQEADTPAPRAAPPTPLQPSTLLTDRMTEGFPCKPPRLRPNNPLLTLLHSDPRFLPPPPTFCLGDFLQSPAQLPVASSLTPTRPHPEVCSQDRTSQEELVL